MKPLYDLKKFKRTCLQRPASINFYKDAEEDASRDFGLNSREDITSFVVDEGIDDHEFYKSDPWGMAKDGCGVDAMVDVYDFWSGEKFGYFSLMQAANGYWYVKSLKLNTKPDPRKANQTFISVIGENYDRKK